MAAPVDGDVASFGTHALLSVAFTLVGWLVDQFVRHPVERQVDTLKNDLFQAVASLQRERDVFSEKLKVRMRIHTTISMHETLSQLV